MTSENKEYFDDYSGNYNEILSEQLSFFNKDVSYFARYKVKLLNKIFPDKKLKILDYGCGIGRSIPFIKEYYPSASIYGFDVSGNSIATARKENPGTDFFDNEEQLKNLEFDIIIMTCVVHHITEKDRPKVFKTINSLLSHNGKLVVFEHNPYNPVTLKMVRECPFDEDAELITLKNLNTKLTENGFKKHTSFYTLFLPAFLKKFMFIEKFIKWLPLGGQYIYIAEKG